MLFWTGFLNTDFICHYFYLMHLFDASILNWFGDRNGKLLFLDIDSQTCKLALTKQYENTERINRGPLELGWWSTVDGSMQGSTEGSRCDWVLQHGMCLGIWASFFFKRLRGLTCDSIWCIRMIWWTRFIESYSIQGVSKLASVKNSTALNGFGKWKVTRGKLVGGSIIFQTFFEEGEYYFSGWSLFNEGHQRKKKLYSWCLVDHGLSTKV